MAPKRRAEDGGDPQPLWAPSSQVSNFGQGSNSSGLDRRVKLKQYITALNSQFVEWVTSQQASHLHELWNIGVKDYLRHANQIVQDFKDVLDGELPGTARPDTASDQPAKPARVGNGSFTGNWGTDSSAGSGGGFGSLGSQSLTPAEKPAGGAFGFSSVIRAAVQTPEKSAGDGKTDTSGQAASLSGPAAFGFPSASSAGAGGATGSLFGTATNNSTAGINNSSSTQQAAVTADNGKASDAGKATGGSSFGAATGSTQAAGATGQFSFGTAAAGGFGGFGSTTGTDNSSKNPFKFGSTATASGTSKAGAGDESAKKGTEGTAGNLFSFPTSAAASAQLPKPSFGAAPPSFFLGGTAAAGAAENGSGGAAAAATEEEAEEEPQKFESAIQANEEAGTIHFQSKAKLSHYQQNKTWESKGLGQLMLRTPKDQPNKPYISFTTEAGRVLYCANILQTMRVFDNEARKTVSWSTYWSVDGTSPATMESMQAVLPKGKVEDFKAAVSKLQGQML